MNKIAIPTVVAVSVLFALAGCAAGSATPETIPATAITEPTMSTSNPSETPSPSASDPDATTAFTVTSADFADGDELAESAKASAFDGQCTGDNINPALEWSNLPEGTVTLAIAMTDESANGWVHWLHANIPADVTGVASGASADLAGVTGRDQAMGQAAYFGPCPPGPNHRYVFTVYALDAELALEESYSFSDFVVAMKDHVLGKTAITGMASGGA